MSALNYRPDIDGLRALAVTSVVLFHAYAGWIPGGFVGVDIFFVISGFLITSIIIKNDEPILRFLFKFFERRIRRLIPPAIPVLIFCIAIAWVYLSPEDMTEFGGSLASHIVFSSNWFFLSEAGYFDGPSHYKLLLHTWSLSVEEQFYILFPPVLLALGGRILARRIMLCSMVLISFGLNVYFAETGQLENAFFNSIGRFWEIGIGSLLAVGVVREPKSFLFRTFLGALGVAGLAHGLFFLDSSAAFPGIVVLPTVIGTAALILARGSLINLALSNVVFVGLGLISYALYLWHWPIFVFIAFEWPNASWMHYVLGTIAAVALSIISYFFLEIPFRKRSILKSTYKAYAFFAVNSLMFASIGLTFIVNEGVPSRFSINFSDYEEHLEAQKAKFEVESGRRECWVGGNFARFNERISQCTSQDSDVLVVGDSHSSQYIGALRENLHDKKIDQLSVSSCPLVKGYVTDNRQACMALVDWFYEPKNLKYYDTVIVSVQNLNNNAVRDLARRLVQLSIEVDVEIVFLGPIPYASPNMPMTFPSQSGNERKQVTAALRDTLHPRTFGYEEIYENIFVNSSVRYISMQSFLCAAGPDSCDVLDREGWPILIDNSHLSPKIARELISKAFPRL